MTEREAIEAIYQRWAEGWAARHPSDPNDPNYVPYTFDNEEFSKDTLGQLGSWARVTVQMSTREQATMGSAPNRKFENNGRVFVQLFTPVNQGRALRATLADDVREALEGRSIDELQLHEATTRGENWFSTGPASEGSSGWSMSTIVVEFRYTETR